MLAYFVRVQVIALKLLSAFLLVYNLGPSAGEATLPVIALFRNCRTVSAVQAEFPYQVFNFQFTILTILTKPLLTLGLVEV